MKSDASTSVLITGCSSGIGRAAAIHLATRSYCVYATARRPETIEDLAGHGCRLLRLDVCDEASMQEAVRSVEGGRITTPGTGVYHASKHALAAGPLEAVARVIERAITAARPRSRYVVPAASRLFVAFGRWLPDHLWDAVMRRRYHAPGETR